MSGKRWLNDRTVFSVPVTPVVRHCDSKDFECHWAKGDFTVIIIPCIFRYKVGPGFMASLILRLNEISRISLKSPIWHQGIWPTFTEQQLKCCCKEVIFTLKGKTWIKHSRMCIISEALNDKKLNKCLYKQGSSEKFTHQMLNCKGLIRIAVRDYLVFFCTRKK